MAATEAERAAAAAAAEEAQSEANNTLIAANDSVAPGSGSRLPAGILRNAGASSGIPTKKKAKPRMTVKEKKERNVS